MKIAIIGAGYVSLVTGACLAELGYNVTCMDKDGDRINRLKAGEVPIYEPGLEPMVAKNVKEGRLRFSKDLGESLVQARAVFLGVGTPSSRRGDGYADLSYVYGAAREIAHYLWDYTVVIDKSTVPVGTARQVKWIIREENPDVEVDVVSNPEFLREGAAINDFMRPDRVVIGTDAERAVEVMKEVYNPLYLSSIPLIFINPETAELIKYASNAFLAMKISFINEMANVCEEVGADAIDLAQAVGLDHRIGSKCLHPGPGYGGSCIPKDTVALMRTAQENGVVVRSVEAAVEVNAAQKARMVKKIRDALGGSETGKIIAALGLTYKPETDDLREAPALIILSPLLEKGACIRAHDPQGMKSAAERFPEFKYVNNAYEACDGADVLVLFTEWDQYRALDIQELKKRLKFPVFVDLRNVYQPEQMRKAGFSYYGVGKI